VRLHAISNCLPPGGEEEKFVTINNNEERDLSANEDNKHSGLIRNAMYYTDLFATGRRI
jgi:hypothetical protein